MGPVYLFLACLTAIAFILGIQATHFRGGTISWEHLQSNGTLHRIKFFFRLGWRRQNRCNADTVNNGLIYDGGTWNLVSEAKSANFPHSVAIVCSSFDIGEDWAYGFNSFIADVETSGLFSISFSSGNWIGGMAFGSGGSWSVALIDIDLTRRSDTGKTNHPPSTLSPPVIRLQLGCLSSIRINVLDADDDVITCRYAVGWTECADVCGTYQHFTLNKTTCTIDYDGGGGAYLVPVALMVEDHPRQTIILGEKNTVTTSDALSSIPLQILVNINQSEHACNQVPTYPSFGVQPDTVIAIAESGILNETLYAYPSTATLAILQFVIVGPIGLESSPIYSVGDGIYATNIIWKSTGDQGGMHIVCYYAVDTADLRGEQRCFTVEVAAVSSPCDVHNGGCSDVCLPQGRRMSCICSEPCWVLSFDRKTCAPDMNVTCSGEDVDIYMEQCASSQPFVVGKVFGDIIEKNCQSSFHGSSHYLNIRPLDCNSTIESNSFCVEYGLKLWAWKGKTYEGISDAVTRGIWKAVSITCSLPMTESLTGSFIPILPFDDEFFSNEVTVAGIGRFELFFEFYKSNTFEIAFAPRDYPIKATVNDDLYFALGAVGRGGLVLFTQSCVAMSNNTLDTSDLYYYFISDGCFLDPTLVGYSTSNRMVNRFSIKAFEFKSRLSASRLRSDIYISCEIILCDASDNATRCFQGCVPSKGRRKRSLKTNEIVSGLNKLSRKTRNAHETDEDDNSDLPLVITVSSPQDVASRFVLVAETVDNFEKASMRHDEKKTGYSVWILSGCVVALLIVGVFIACYVVKNKSWVPKPEIMILTTRCDDIRPTMY